MAANCTGGSAATAHLAPRFPFSARETWNNCSIHTQRRHDGYVRPSQSVRSAREETTDDADGRSISYCTTKKQMLFQNLGGTSTTCHVSIEMSLHNRSNHLQYTLWVCVGNGMARANLAVNMPGASKGTTITSRGLVWLYILFCSDSRVERERWAPCIDRSLVVRHVTSCQSLTVRGPFPVFFKSILVMLISGSFSFSSAFHKLLGFTVCDHGRLPRELDPY